MTASNPQPMSQKQADALPRALTRQELLASVPIRKAEGGRHYVDLADIPQPWREEFWAALHGSGRPIVEWVERAAYAWDWEDWVENQLPTGRAP